MNHIDLTKKISGINEIIKNASDEELDAFVRSDDWLIRRAVAIRQRDKDLDILIKDDHYGVRKLVARYGRDKDLDILVRDNEHEVRYEVAKRGRLKDLDILVYDEFPIIRKEVAKHGYDKHLKILIDDRSKTVRQEVDNVMTNKAILVKKESSANTSNFEPITFDELDMLIGNQNKKDDKQLLNDLENLKPKTHEFLLEEFKEPIPKEKVSFKTKITNFFNKFIKKNKK